MHVCLLNIWKQWSSIKSRLATHVPKECVLNWLWWIWLLFNPLERLLWHVCRGLIGLLSRHRGGSGSSGIYYMDCIITSGQMLEEQEFAAKGTDGVADYPGKATMSWWVHFHYCLATLGVCHQTGWKIPLKEPKGTLAQGDLYRSTVNCASLWEEFYTSEFINEKKRVCKQVK